MTPVTSVAPADPEPLLAAGVQAQGDNVGQAPGTCVWSCSCENYFGPCLCVPGSGYEDHERWNRASFTTGHPKPRGPDPVSDLSPDREVPGGDLNCNWGSERGEGVYRRLLGRTPSPVTGSAPLTATHLRPIHAARSFSWLYHLALCWVLQARCPGGTCWWHLSVPASGDALNPSRASPLGYMPEERGHWVLRHVCVQLYKLTPSYLLSSGGVTAPPTLWERGWHTTASPIPDAF